MRSHAMTVLGLATLCLGLAHAAPSPSQQADAVHSHKAISAKDRAPVSSSLEHLRHDPNQLSALKKARAAAAAACDPTLYTTRSGAALVDAVRNSTTNCINELFSLSGSNAQKAFNESQMRSVADGLRKAALAYDGTNSGGIQQLVLFLRAGYFVQYYAPEVVGSYGGNLQTGIRAALDAFFGNANSRLANEANGATLSEAVTLIDSAGENARYLSVVRWLLDSYAPAWDASWSMKSAVNNSFTVLFRGHQNDDFAALAPTDSSTHNAINAFINRNWGKLGGSEGYLVNNAARELARYLQYTGARATLRPMVQALVQRSGVTGVSAPVWMGLADMTDYQDPGQCSYYGLCDWKARAEAAALPLRQVCSPTLTLRAQSMTPAEMNAACTSVINEEGYFHTKLQTNKTPVAGDLNSNLELVVFNSSSDYVTYAGALFGIDTNNGGMYLEGNPSQPGNQARFVAYEAEWLLPKFEVWNLNHEYTHYLDGRFDMAGDFSAGTSTPTIWWVEGLAEHVSYCYRNIRYDAAFTEAAKLSFTLNEIFDNTYSSGTTRVYRWGYLAVSFMMERHRADITTLLGHYRKGDYTTARSFVKSTIGAKYDAEFRSWLQSVPNTGVTCNAPTANQPPTAKFDVAVNGLSANFTDRSTDAEGSVVTWRWTFHDGSQSNVQNPTKFYSGPGTYPVTLEVWDNGRLGARTEGSVKIDAKPCPTRTDEMANGCVRTGLSGRADDVQYFYIYVDRPNVLLSIQSGGGLGNADLYASRTGWASPSSYQLRSTKSDNGETVQMSIPTAGYYYLSLHGAAAYSGVSLTTKY